MGLNQFAKISPVVNSSGYLLEKKENGEYKNSGVLLKNNETGICIEDNSIIVMLGENNPVKLTGGLYNDIDSAKNYISNNSDGKYNGQLIVTKDNPSNVYVINYNQLYNLTENATKTIVVKIPKNVNQNTNNFIEIENSIMQEIYSRKYLINSIDIKIPGETYTFKNNNSDIIKYPKLSICGSINGSEDIVITDNCYKNNTKCITNDEFKGKLHVKMIDQNNNSVVSYEGNTISLIIIYTPINTD